jgi:hypothetical protein
MLVADNVLSAPILPISGYFERIVTPTTTARRFASVARSRWVQFFCEGVEQQANQAAARVRALVEIGRAVGREAIGDRSALSSVID